jgi:hypothetical protein
MIAEFTKLLQRLKDTPMIQEHIFLYIRLFPALLRARPYCIFALKLLVFHYPQTGGCIDPFRLEKHLGLGFHIHPYLPDISLTPY